MTKDAGFKPRAVPVKLLFPLLEGASLEEDEDLHTMWAALLANAANPAGDRKIPVAFCQILSELSPDDAALFSRLYNDALKDYSRDMSRKAFGPMGELIVGPLEEVRTTVGGWAAAPDFNAAKVVNGSFDNLIRVRLLAVHPRGISIDSFVIGLRQTELADTHVSITSFGLDFIEACQPPKQAS